MAELVEKADQTEHLKYMVCMFLRQAGDEQRVRELIAVKLPNLAAVR